MKLNELISGLNGWHIADPETDNVKILHLYKSLSMEGGIFRITFLKDPDYYRFCRYEAPKSWVMLAVNDDGEPEGMVTANLRPCYVNGKKEHVVHYSDLRILPKKKRKSDFSWTDLGMELIKKGREIEEYNGCKYAIGSFVAANKYAIKAIKDQSPWSISNIAYYNMVIFGMRKPLKWIGKKSHVKSDLKFTISQAVEADIPSLKSYLDRQNRDRPLGYIYEGNDAELERRFREWDGFSISSFYLAKNPSGEIIGCYAIWDPGKGRRILVDRYPFYLIALSITMKLFKRKVALQGTELEILYFTNLEFSHGLTIEQKRYLLNEFIDDLYKRGIPQKYHMTAFCDYMDENLSMGMEKDYVLMKTPTYLYQLYPEGTSDEDIIDEEKVKYHSGQEMVLT